MARILIRVNKVVTNVWDICDEVVAESLGGGYLLWFCINFVIWNNFIFVFQDDVLKVFAFLSEDKYIQSNDLWVLRHLQFFYFLLVGLIKLGSFGFDSDCVSCTESMIIQEHRHSYAVYFFAHQLLTQFYLINSMSFNLFAAAYVPYTSYDYTDGVVG